MSNTNEPQPAGHSQAAAERKQRRGRKPRPPAQILAARTVTVVIAVMTVTVAAATVVGFWLSYGGLHTFAVHAGLRGNEAWAWPASVDLFIAAGEAGVTLAYLRQHRDPMAWAYLVLGFGASVTGNILHVDLARLAWTPYAAAAVPPAAALLALAALMRQVYLFAVQRAAAAPAKAADLPPAQARQRAPRPARPPARTDGAGSADDMDADDRARLMIAAALESGLVPGARTIAREGLGAPGRRRYAQSLIDEAVRLKQQNGN